MATRKPGKKSALQPRKNKRITNARKSSGGSKPSATKKKAVAKKSRKAVKTTKTSSASKTKKKKSVTAKRKPRDGGSIVPSPAAITKNVPEAPTPDASSSPGELENRDSYEE